MHFVSIVLLLTFALPGTAMESTRPSLPMGASTRRAGTPIYLSPEARESYTALEAAGEHVGAWASQPGWVRITPPGFTPEGWVRVSEIQLDPRSQALPKAPYLEQLLNQHEEYAQSKTISACAILIKPIAQVYDSTASEMRPLSWDAADEYKPGEILTVYRRGDNLYETRPDASWIQTAVWIPREFLELAEPIFDDDGPWCSSDSNGDSYTFAVSGTFRAGPSASFPVTAPYNAGEKVEVSKRYSGGWWATSYNHSLGLAWFRDIDIVPVSAHIVKVGVRLHAEPDSRARILAAIQTANPYLRLYERRTNWYRVTPDSFAPAAWILASDVVLAPNYQPDSSIPEYYLAALTPEPERATEYSRESTWRRFFPDL